MTMFKASAENDARLADITQRVAEKLVARGQSLVAAESCTGGLVAAACTEISGSSAWFERGFVTYSNRAKEECLGVAPDTLATYGAVSEAVVAEMLAGALAASATDWSVAVSGVAGPDGGIADKPVGTVVIGWQQRDETGDVTTVHFDGDRAAVRQASVIEALAGLERRLAARTE